MEVAVLLGSALGVNESLVGVGVLLSVVGCVGGSGLASSNASLLGFGTLVGKVLEELGISLLFLEDVLRDRHVRG